MYKLSWTHHGQKLIWMLFQYEYNCVEYHSKSRVPRTCHEWKFGAAKMGCPNVQNTSFPDNFGPKMRLPDDPFGQFRAIRPMELFMPVNSPPVQALPSVPWTTTAANSRNQHRRDMVQLAKPNSREVKEVISTSRSSTQTLCVWWDPVGLYRRYSERGSGIRRPTYQHRLFAMCGEFASSHYKNTDQHTGTETRWLKFCRQRFRAVFSWCKIFVFYSN